jgi:hypothetical protein
MRAFKASLTVILGIAAGSLGISACSDSTDASGTGGAAGKTSTGEAGEAGETSGVGGSGTAGSGAGGASAGSTGDAGAAGAGECSFQSQACLACIGGKCMTQAGACQADAECGPGIGGLVLCACDPENTLAECKTSFSESGGDAADALIECYDANCTEVCEQ